MTKVKIEQPIKSSQNLAKYIAPNKVLKAKHLFKTYRFYHKNLPEPLKSIRQYIPNLCIHVLHMFSTLIE